jgi:thiosulfate dehydrogenase [quinone] large subunit
MHKNNGRCCDPQSWAVALARWCLGVIFLFFGMGKLPDVSGFAKGLVGQFSKTWLPDWLLAPYAYAVPYVEVILGALLILGLWRNVVLSLTGLYLISLTFGLVLLKQPAAFNNFAYTVATAAILFLERYDCLVIGGCREETEAPILPAAAANE